MVVEQAPISESTLGSESRPQRALPRYALAGAIDLSENSLRLQVRLLDRGDGGVLWANSYYSDLNAAQLLEVESDLASPVASALAQPYGVIFHADASRHFGTPPDDWEAYACTLLYYAYSVSLDAATYPSVRKCLERAVERFPDYTTHGRCFRRPTSTRSASDIGSTHPHRPYRSIGRLPRRAALSRSTRATFAASRRRCSRSTSTRRSRPL